VTVWLYDDEEAALREAAYKRRVSEASLIREAIRRHSHRLCALAAVT